MKFSLHSIKSKIKNFLKLNFRNDIFFLFKNTTEKTLRIFLEDVNSFDKELYFILLKKPEKVITLFELTIKKLIEKKNNTCIDYFNVENFQIILLRKVFSNIPKKITDILEGVIVSFRIMVVSTGAIKLKIQKINNYPTYKKYMNKIKNFYQVLNYSPKILNISNSKLINTSFFFIDYQTIIGKGFFESNIVETDHLDLILILEKNFVGKFFPGNEFFISGISMFYNANKENNCWVIKVLGFSKISFSYKFQKNNFYGNLDKNFIKFARSKNIYKWIYSLILPEIDCSIDIKRSISCLLFGGNEKILANEHTFNGQINIVILGENSEIFSSLNYTLNALNTLPNLKKKILEDEFHTDGKIASEFLLEKFSFSKINQISHNFKVLLIEKFQNLNINEQLDLEEILEPRSFLCQKNLFNYKPYIISTIAFFDGVFKKDLYKSKNIHLESNILMENLKRFDLVIKPSKFHEKSINKKNFVADQSFTSDLNTNFDSKIRKLNIAAFDFLRNYIMFVREKFRPNLSKHASELLKNAYLFLKISKKKQEMNRLSGTNRVKKLESMIKISESIAKMRMANEIGSGDALEAVHLIQNYEI